MPVDKFGRNSYTKTTYDGCVSLSYISRNFQRKGEAAQQAAHISDELKAYIDEYLAARADMQSSPSGLARSPKPIITVWAEAEGALSPGSFVFSFGHSVSLNSSLGGRQHGYVALANGRILRIGVKSTYEQRNVKSDVIIHVTVNGNPTNGYGCTQDATRQSGVEIFATPLEFNQGDVINFICVRGNADTKSTLASALIELDL